MRLPMVVLDNEDKKVRREFLKEILTSPSEAADPLLCMMLRSLLFKLKRLYL